MYLNKYHWEEEEGTELKFRFPVFRGHPEAAGRNMCTNRWDVYHPCPLSFHSNGAPCHDEVVPRHSSRLHARHASDE